MRFPWISRKWHDEMIDTQRTIRETILERARDEARRETARAAEWQKTAEQALEQAKEWYATAKEAEARAALWEDRCQEANVQAAAVHTCGACAAKDQTIALMADVVDFERARAVQMPQRPGAESAVRVLPTRPEAVEDRKWATDEEEAIMGALQSGALGADAEEAYERASKMMAAIGAQNVEIQVVK